MKRAHLFSLSAFSLSAFLLCSCIHAAPTNPVTSVVRSVLVNTNTFKVVWPPTFFSVNGTNYATLATYSAGTNTVYTTLVARAYSKAEANHLFLKHTAGSQIITNGPLAIYSGSGEPREYM
ncbi:MAG TPA: hypothetical protein P5069_11705, partial [Candidatus Hydrogenedentes bacterium]|nr:hypothetical protein [Candidatus Hydrogenedentota bacterium]